MQRSPRDNHAAATIGWLVLALLVGGHATGIGVEAVAAQDPGGSEAYIQQVPASDVGGANRSVLAIGAPPDGPDGGEVFPNAAVDGGDDVLPSCERVALCAPASTLVTPIDFSPPERGGRNVARVVQAGTGTTVGVVQRGSGHDAQAMVTGLGTSFTAVQSGSRNLIRSSVGGVENSLSVTQDGTNLTYLDEFSFQGSALSGEIVQRGSDLSMVQEGTWPGGFGVTQRGTGPGPLSSIRIQHRQGLPMVSADSP